MKSFSISYKLIIVLLIIPGSVVQAQNWTPRTDLNSGYVFHTSVFTINDRIFVANTGGRKFYEYNITTDTWVQKNDLPVALMHRGASAAFVVNGKGYLAGGTDLQIVYDDLWEYDPNNDSWTAKGTMPMGRRSHMTSFVINNKVYIGGGITTLDTTALTPQDSFKNDFWEYDPTGNQWTQKATIPYDSSFLIDPFQFVIGDKGYIACGGRYQKINGIYHQNPPVKTFAYDPATDTWTPRADFAGQPRWGGASFVLYGKAYCSMGWTNIPPNPHYGDLYSYDPVADRWDPIAVTNALKPRRYPIAAVLSTGRVFAGRGIDSNNYVQTDWWELEHTLGIETPDADKNMSLYPNPCSTELRFSLPKNNNRASYIIYDYQGKVMSEGKIQKNDTIGTSSLPAGNYLLVVKQGEDVYRKLFTVQQE